MVQSMVQSIVHSPGFTLTPNQLHWKEKYDVFGQKRFNFLYVVFWTELQRLWLLYMLIQLAATLYTVVTCIMNWLAVMNLDVLLVQL